MEMVEIESLTLDLYRLLDVDATKPPGPFRLAVLAWGPGALRYVREPRIDPTLLPDGWILELPEGTRSGAMTMRIARALGRWAARRFGRELDADSEYLLSLTIVMPAPALQTDVLRRGLTATEIGRLFGVDASLVAARVSRMLAHGSGERPSATMRTASKA